jgi:undecaprenyl-diphosphatase
MLLSIDADILVFLQEHVRNPILNPFFILITHLGDAGIFWILLTLVMLCFKKTRRPALYSVGALLLSVLINNAILKNAVARIRPYEVIEGLKLIEPCKLFGIITLSVKKATDFSFPSGHTAASFASAIAMYRYMPKKWMSVSLIILAALISFSRLYIGIHYPTDVLGGFISGLLIGIVVNVVGDKIYKKLGEKK